MVGSGQRKGWGRTEDGARERERKREMEGRRGRGRKQLQSSIWILLAAVGKI